MINLRCVKYHCWTLQSRRSIILHSVGVGHKTYFEIFPQCCPNLRLSDPVVFFGVLSFCEFQEFFWTFIPSSPFFSFKEGIESIYSEKLQDPGRFPEILVLSHVYHKSETVIPSASLFISEYKTQIQFKPSRLPFQHLPLQLNMALNNLSGQTVPLSDIDQ